jgi:methionine-rich copper-binding protein CopC
MSRLGAVLSLVVLALLGGTGTAIARATFISSDPADRAIQASAPHRVTLVFDEPLPQGLNTIAITGPGQTRWETGEVSTSGNTISVAMKPSGPAGDYTIGYRIVSDDGHPLTGTVGFRLTTPGTSSQPPATTTAAPGAAGAQSTQPAEPSRFASQPVSSNSTSVWPWVAGGIALVAVAGGVAALLRRRSSASRQ